jgi:hypothetical protein
LAKNQAFQQAQQAATPQAMGLGNVQEFGIPSVIPKDQYVEMMKEAAAPGAQMAQATADRVAAESGFGAPGLTTSTMGNRMGTAMEGIKGLGTESGRDAFMNNVGGWSGLAKTGGAAAAPLLADALKPQEAPEMQSDKDMGQRYTYTPGKLEGPYKASPTGIEQRYFTPQYNKVSNEQAKNIFGFADGGLAEPGTPTEYSYDPAAQMYSRISTPSSARAVSQQNSNPQHGGGGRNTTANENGDTSNNSFGESIGNALGINSGDVGGMIGRGLMSMALPGPLGLLTSIAMSAANSGDTGIGPASSAGESASSSTGSGNQGAKAAAISAGVNGESPGSTPGGESPGGAPGGGGDARGGYLAHGQFDQRPMAMGGLSDAHYNLGSYSDGGRLLRGPGDGVSDSIPATIGKKQPARLADGEFVVPARIVSELGNGSTEAGARKLYAMMDRIQKTRSSTVGKGNVAKNSRADRYLPA